MINACLDWNCIIALEEGRESASALRQMQEWYKQGKIALCISSPSRLENSRSLEKRVIDEDEWKEKLNNVGLENIELRSSRTRTYRDANGDHHFLDVEIEQLLMREAHNRLFPNVPFLLSDYARDQHVELPQPSSIFFTLQMEREQENEIQRSLVRKWNNKKNDALSIYTFGTWSGSDDVFVTDDKHHLLKRRARLQSPYEITRSVLVEVQQNDGERNLQKRAVTQVFHNVIPGHILSPKEAVDYLREQIEKKIGSEP